MRLERLQHRRHRAAAIVGTGAEHPTVERHIADPGDIGQRAVQRRGAEASSTLIASPRSSRLSSSGVPAATTLPRSTIARWAAS